MAVIESFASSVQLDAFELTHVHTVEFSLCRGLNEQIAVVAPQPVVTMSGPAAFLMVTATNFIVFKYNCKQFAKIPRRRLVLAMGNVLYEQ